MLGKSTARRFRFWIVLGVILSGLAVHLTPAAAQTAVVQFDYPVDGQKLGYEGDFLFRVQPIKGATHYLWGFFQDNLKIWENWRDEKTYSSNEYGIVLGSAAYHKFKRGPVKVSVRAFVNGAWTNATVITIYLGNVATASVVDKIRTGQPFWVVLDATHGKFDDTVYSGSDLIDPLGTLKGGEVYKVVYDDTAKSWTVTGFNQGTNGVLTATYNNADAQEHELSLWGRVFYFTKEGKVIDEQYGLVGHILFEQPKAD